MPGLCHNGDMVQRYFGSASAKGRFPDPMRGPWTVTAHYGEQDGEVVCIGLDIRAFRGTPGDADNPPRPLTRGSRWEPITANMVRGLRVPELVQEGRRNLAELGAWLERQPGPARRAAKKAATKRTAGRPTTWDEAHYRKVADLYRANQGHGVAKAVYEALALEGYFPGGEATEQADRAKVRKWIATARNDFKFI